MTLDAAQDDLRPGLAGEPDLEPGRPELAEPAGRPLHAGRRLRDVRLLHRGRQRRGRRVDHVRASSPRMTTSSSRASPAIRTPSATSATPTTSRTRTRSRPSRSTAARAASRRPTTTIDDGTYAPLSRPLFIYPNTGNGQGVAGPQRVRQLLPRQCRHAGDRADDRLRRRPGRRRRAAGGRLDHRRPAVTASASRDAPAELGTAGASPSSPTAALG